MRRRFILWDNDGVLVDTERWYYAATRETIARLGIELSRETYLDYSSRAQSCWDLAREAGVPEDAVNDHRRARDVLYREYLRTRDIAIDGAAEVVERLARAFRMGVVTSAAPEDVELQHGRGTILKSMEFVLTGDQTPHYKPHPAPYLAALARFGAAPEEAVVIEDSAQGLQAARGAGIDCILVRNAFTAPGDVSAAWRCLETIRDLPALLLPR